MHYLDAYRIAQKFVQRSLAGLAAAILIVSTGGVLPVIFTAKALAAPATVTVCPSVCAYADTQSAVNAASSGDTIQLNSDQSISSQITITKPLTLDGNGHTISPTFAYTGNNANNSSVGIAGTSDVTLTNLIIDGGASTNLHGINIYESTNINLSNVTSENNDKDGIVVNGSTVTVESLSTSGNGWGGIDVDQGSGVTDPASLTVHAASYQEEIAAIVVDNVTKAVLVTDTDSQYTHVDSGNLRIYTQIPTGIANQSPFNGTYTTTAGLTKITWQAATSPHGPLSYYYESSNSISTKADGSFASPAYGPVSTSTNTYIPAGGTPQGVWYWQVRAKDQLGNYSAWTTPWKITVDNTAPSVPAITAPSNGQYFKSTPILDSWTASTDNLSGVDHYQIAYLYDDGHTFGGSTCSGVQISGKSVSGCRDTTGTSRDHMPGVNEQGGVTIWVRAFDKSGNASAWSAPVHYYYDSTAPVVAITNPINGAYVKGIIQITGTITDNNPDHYYLVILDQNKNVVAGPGVVNSPATSFSYSWDTSKLKDGAYTIDLEARDKANNKDANSVQTIQVTVDNTAPVITDKFTVTMLTGDKVILNPQVTDTTAVTYQWSVTNSDSKLLNNPKDTRDGTTLVIGPAPKGNYTVTLTVTDAAGNSAAAQYAVTISTPAQNATLVSNFNTPQTLGANTSGNSDTNTDTPNTPTDNNGHVKGDSTTVTADTKPQVNLNIKNASGFLGLGWWWLAVLAALLACFVLVIFRRSGTDDKRN